MTQMRRRGTIMKFMIIAEHREKMFFKSHHQRMNPCIENHIRAFKAHLRRIACREILHMHGCGNHGAGKTHALGDMAFHLRAEN